MHLGSTNHSRNRNSRYFSLGIVGLLSLSFCILWGQQALAAPTSKAQAQAAVSHWIAKNGRPLGAKLGRTVRQTETTVDADGQPIYHVVYLTENGTSSAGYVIVSGDDEAEPIVAFCSGEHFDPSPKTPLGALVAADLPTRVALARHTKPAGLQAWLPATETKQKWDTLTQTTTTKETLSNSISDIRVAPLIASQWDQRNVSGTACYNYYTPPGAGGASTNYYSGCVATAMSQLMRYYQYPTAAVGVKRFTITINRSTITKPMRGGNGSGGAYDWANMTLLPLNGATTTQRQAIGALLYDAGLSVNMAYGYNGSGAETLDTADALINTFFYSNAVKGYNSDSDIGAPLVSMVNPNLDAGFPVLFGITNIYQEGHAIVCDGYGYNSSTLYHHLNMGWSGDSDAWYTLPDINANGITFSVIYKCVYNVFVTGSGEIISGRVTDSISNPIAGATVTAARTGGGTYTATTNSKGIYALSKIPSSSTYTLSVTKGGYAFSGSTVSIGKSSDYTATSGNVWGADFTGSQQTPWGTWRSAHFSAAEIQDPTISGALSTPDNDGICNLLKYAFNLGRKNPDRSALPQIAMENGFLTLTYVSNKSATDLTYTVEVSGDLQTWNSGTSYTTSPVLVSDDGVIQKFKVIDLTPPSTDNTQFMRLRVTVP